MNGIRDVAGAVKKNIFVAFDDADAWAIEVLGEPGVGSTRLSGLA
jgi:hypothetical protein